MILYKYKVYILEFKQEKGYYLNLDIYKNLSIMNAYEH